MRLLIKALGLTACLVTTTQCDCGTVHSDPHPPEGVLTVTPKTVEAKTTDPPFDLTVKSEALPLEFTTVEVEVTHAPTGIVSPGVVDAVSGAKYLEASGKKFYFWSETGRDEVKVTLKCLSPGKTKLTFVGRFQRGHFTAEAPAVDVEITCTGPDPVTQLAELLLKLGYNQKVAWLTARLANMIDHSTGTVASVKAKPDLLALASVLVPLAQAAANSAFNNSELPCGQGKEAYTVCPADKKPFPAGDTVVVAHKMDQAAELNDTKYSWTYGFVFDQDNDSSNNYQAAAQYPKDFYQDSDRWYEANYKPGQGWTQKVSDAAGSAVVPGPASAARIVFFKQMAALVVPASELKVKDPKFRLTIFRHTGDYGINPPHDWSGDMEPPVDQGLRAFGK